MSNLKTQLREIINKYIGYSLHNKDMTVDQCRKEATDQILKAVEGVVPEEKKHICLLGKDGKEYRSQENWIKYGHNVCRDEMMKKVKGSE